MIKFIIGAILVIAVLLLVITAIILCTYMKDRIEYKRIKEEFGEDFEIRVKPKS